MPVVTRNSSIIRATSGVVDFVSGAAFAGAAHYMAGRVTTAADDSNTSAYTLAFFPSNAIMLRGGTLRWSALGGSCAGRMRFVPPGTPAGVTNSGVESLTLATANVAEPLTNHNDVNLVQELWQLCGLSADPRTPIPAVLTLTADAAAAGGISFIMPYLMPK